MSDSVCKSSVVAETTAFCSFSSLLQKGSAPRGASETKNCKATDAGRGGDEDGADKTEVPRSQSVAHPPASCLPGP